MIQTNYNVVCDICKESCEPVEAISKQQAREILTEQAGWNYIYKGREDICPDCQESRKIKKRSRKK